MAKFKKPRSEGEFRHGTSIGPGGEILYDCPVEIRNKQDLDNYGIGWNDCKTLNFHGSEKVTVYFMKVESRPLAEFLWADLDSQHSRGYASTRCMIPGKRKAFIKCPDTISCAKCPYKDVKQAPVISWDGLIESGYEPAEAPSVEEQIDARLEYSDIVALMDSEDRRIRASLELKERGYKVAEIAAKLNVSESRVYQLLARAKSIGRKYVEKDS